MNEYMNEYINDIFNIVIELYKDVAPEVIATAFKIDLNAVRELKVEDIKKKLNNMNIDYQVVNNDEYIAYKDYTRKKIAAKYIEEKEPVENDKLIMYVNEPEMLNKTSVDEIKQMRLGNGISKIISDIDYITHELTHGLEHLIALQNPSYVDSLVVLMKEDIDNPEAYKEKYDIAIGEMLPVSMERIILDRLRQPNMLEKYNLNRYANIKDVEDVWHKRKIQNSISKEKYIGKSKSGKKYYILDTDMILYFVAKKYGISSMVDYVRCSDRARIYSSLPKKDNAEDTLKLCNRIEDVDFSDFLISNISEYRPRFSEREIKETYVKMSRRRNAEIPNNANTKTVNDNTIDSQLNVIIGNTTISGFNKMNQALRTNNKSPHVERI